MTDPSTGISIMVDGAALNPTLAGQIIDVRVSQSLFEPHTALIRIADPAASNIDSHPFKLGAKLTISMGARGASTFEKVFIGEVMTNEPEFSRSSCIIAIRAYDEAYKLTKGLKSKTYQDESASAIAKRVALAAKLKTGKIESTEVTYPFIQQVNETDWDFLWRLATMCNYRVGVTDGALDFRPWASKETAIKVTWPIDLTQFLPRVTGVQQVDKVTVRHRDPKTATLLEGSGEVATTRSEIGLTRTGITGKVGGGTVVVSDQVVGDAAEAKAVAGALMAQLAESFIEAEGILQGNPKVKAGTPLTVEGVGTNFGGKYVPTEVEHIYRSNSAYETHFTVSNRPEQRLASQRQGRGDWASQLVIGLVTNNKDPEKMGRVRVKYPSIDEAPEGWWARVAMINAGAARGVTMLPAVEDEVIVGFEHGDTRKPYVLGSLFTGTALPGEDLAQTDGTLAMKSTNQFKITSDKKMILKSNEEMELNVEKTVTETVKGDYTSTLSKARTMKSKTFELKADSTGEVKTTGSLTVQSEGSLTLKGSSVAITATGSVTISGSVINLG